MNHWTFFRVTTHTHTHTEIGKYRWQCDYKNIIKRVQISQSANYTNLNTFWPRYNQVWAASSVTQQKSNSDNTSNPPVLFSLRDNPLVCTVALCLIKPAGREPRLFALLLSWAVLNPCSSSPSSRTHRPQRQQLQDTKKKPESGGYSVTQSFTYM